MSDGPSGPRDQQPLPGDPLIEHTSAALEKFFEKALADLQKKMELQLQPGPDASPLKGLAWELTQDMIRQLSANVKSAFPSPPPAPPSGPGGAKDDDRRAGRPARDKPARPRR